MLFSVFMRSPHLTSSASIAGLLLLANVPASAQQMPLAGAAMHSTREPFAIETFGIFRNMMLNGDFSPKVQLVAVMAKRPTTAVGAVAEARGEITIYDGKLIVSYGKSLPSIDVTADHAALLAMGTAGQWQTVPVEHDVAPEDVESYIAAVAKTHGIDPDQSFPFQARGGIGPFIMHVNAAPTDGPHGMGQPMAITVERRGDQIQGLVAGLYVAPDLMGVATHGGERTHAHWIAPDLASTAHLDRWGIKAGSVLLLPQ
ncbi:MAG: hypothetical protein ACTHJS_09910 [Xanthobacteraceae bacterium]